MSKEGVMYQAMFEISNCHRELDIKLNAFNLTTVDVLGDGIYFYRAAYYKLHGNDIGLTALFRQVADYIK